MSTSRLEKLTTGHVFGRFTVLEHYKIVNKKSFVEVQCQCGSPVIFVRIDHLKKGTSQSCGCLRVEATKTHGCWGKPLFKVWAAMVRRCTNPKDSKYHRYGGRGIQVCERWLDANNFIADMTAGYEQGLQIDRKDNDGNYEPANCHWTTRAQQARNYSRNVVLEHDGKRMCVVDWADVVGISAKVLYGRVAAGWSPNDVLTKPVNCAVKR